MVRTSLVLMLLLSTQAQASLVQVTKTQAIAALKKAPRGAEVYQCYRRRNALECKRVKLSIVTVKAYALKAVR